MTIVARSVLAVVLGVLCTGMLMAFGDRPMVKIDDIGIRDPYILQVPEEKAYYLYGTTHAMPDGGGGPCFETFVSKDLKEWEGPTTIFRASPDFWGTMHYWAPEVHSYLGKYYLFGTCDSDKRLRATQIFVSENPSGPFTPLTDRPVTPSGWQCLDGTLYVDRSHKPWIVFCHEWVQAHDGEICAVRLTDHLKYADGKPVVLFHASEAPWVKAMSEGNYVTDGPFLYRTKDGTLLMLWSSFGEKGYAVGIARSKSGEITGPWEQKPTPLFDGDGGHAMILHTFDGSLRLVLHSPNAGGVPRVKLIPIREVNRELVIEH